MSDPKASDEVNRRHVPNFDLQIDNDTKHLHMFVKAPGKRKWSKVPETEEELNELLPLPSPLKKPRPPPPAEDLLGLLKKATEHPQSLTDEDRLQILEWVPEAEANARATKYFDSTWQELVNKAAQTPQDLTLDEAEFVWNGRRVTYPDLNAESDRQLYRLGQPEDIFLTW